MNKIVGAIQENPMIVCGLIETKYDIIRGVNARSHRRFHWRREL